MRNLEGLCQSIKVCITKQRRSGITYLTPNVSWQFLRLLLIVIFGPASAKYWLNVTVTAVLSAIGMWVMGICKEN